ncbi:NmrA family NAD(P)-binding protein [Halobacillus sp. A1]|uniref:NmrA family NAD(P)-binding protein n=1 Tax=Halobacillus sp. A1 TaxID=2880262 RepID=UPI0020A68A25|nr:NmrA family NAD(P)-binding protein [Halobacillus sp. A1]MCP3029778.1 NmrA family NAD(P)-binding protein [Halobacillus sp. A1]
MLITGVTGFVGRELAGWFVDKGIPFRSASRHPEAARLLFDDPLIDCKQFDFENSQSYGQVFEGIKSLFLTRPTEIKHVEPIIETLHAAKEAGVQKIVFLSVLGAERMSFLPHRKIEKKIISLGFDYTFLRASSFMQDLLKSQLYDIRERHQLNIPAGSAEISFIDSRDVAEIAFLALMGKTPVNDAVKLTGKQALTCYQVADILSEEIGEEIKYVNPTKYQFLQDCYHRGYSSDFASQLANVYTSSKNGISRRISLEAEKILQREPRYMREFVRDYRNAFIKINADKA